ncbi:MAG: hypothetical protein OIN86_03755 [Candidatus Methanoperedens sp.]|nr:hypothetical protein [Candidatus Methanoperedens sp.]CAG1002065.1 hypothetical protein METP1_02973 [Methanosarcinales archaeon]
MKDTIISLIKKNRNNYFLKNKIELKCKCGFSEKVTYYDFLSMGEFDIGQTTQTISTYISESIYDETIRVTPLNLSRKCPVCGEGITAIFPISLENLIPMLQMAPPDLLMYG